MKRFLPFLSVLAVTTLAHAALTNEVLVLTTSTTIPRSTRTRSVEILNLGPNDIWCAIDGTPVANKSRKIASGGSWGVDITHEIPIKCLASTASQVTGAATIVTEAP